jgi:hypothetical protein
MKNENVENTSFPKFLVSTVLILSIAVLVLGYLVFDSVQKNTPKNPVLVSQNEEAIINNQYPATPELSNQEAALIKADSITAQPVQNQIAQKIYTNEYFPNLKIVYPSDWEFKTETSKSRYDGLLEREIILSKDETRLVFDIEPTFATGCGGYDQPDPIPSYTTKNGLKEYKVYTEDSQEISLDYSTSYGCSLGNLLETNIESNSIPEYTKLENSNNSGKVTYFYDIRGNIENTNKESDNQLAQLRQIIENSNFK